MMKKSLLLFAMALMPFAGVFAQEGGEESAVQTPVVYTKSFQSLIDDAEFIVKDSHYTTGQSALQTAIDEAKASLESLSADPQVDVDETISDAMIRLNNDGVYEAMKTLQSAIDAFVYANPHVDATEQVGNADFSADATNATDMAEIWQGPDQANNLLLIATHSRQWRRAVGYRYATAGKALRDIYGHLRKCK